MLDNVDSESSTKMDIIIILTKFVHVCHDNTTEPRGEKNLGDLEEGCFYE